MEIHSNKVDTLVETAPSTAVGHSNLLVDSTNLLNKPEEGMQLLHILDLNRIFGRIESVGIGSSELLRMALDTIKMDHDYWGGWFLDIVKEIRRLVSIQVFGRGDTSNSRTFGSSSVDLFFRGSKDWIDNTYDGLVKGNVAEFGFILIAGGELKTIYVTLPFSNIPLPNALSPEMFFIGRREALNQIPITKRARKEDPWWEDIKGYKVMGRGTGKRSGSLGVMARECLSQVFTNEQRIWLRSVEQIIPYIIRVDRVPYSRFPPYLSLEVDGVNLLQAGREESQEPYISSWRLASNELTFSDAPSWDRNLTYSIDIRFEGGKEPHIYQIAIKRKVYLGETVWYKNVIITSNGVLTKWYNAKYSKIVSRPSTSDDIKSAYDLLEGALWQSVVHKYFKRDIWDGEKVLVNLLFEAAIDTFERLEI